MSSEHTHTYVFCRIGSRVGAVPVAHVLETLRPLPIEPFAAMPPFLLGVSIVHGGPMPVVDTGHLVGAAELRPEWFVIVGIGQRAAVLAVDAVLGVRALGPEVLSNAPALLTNAAPPLIATIRSFDPELLLVLEACRLFPQDTGILIESPGGSA